jgi:hypothetical protein
MTFEKINVELDFQPNTGEDERVDGLTALHMKLFGLLNEASVFKRYAVSTQESERAQTVSVQPDNGEQEEGELPIDDPLEMVETLRNKLHAFHDLKVQLTALEMRLRKRLQADDNSDSFAIYDGGGGYFLYTPNPRFNVGPLKGDISHTSDLLPPEPNEFSV